MIKWSDKIINEKSVYEKKIYKDLALKKIDDHEFVRDILARAAKGKKLSADVKSDGSIVINGYKFFKKNQIYIPLNKNVLN